jgi:RNA polymerase sigma factor (sigma-70 family)
MATVVSVRFKEVGKNYHFDPCGKEYKCRDKVIVETARGTECGTVTIGNREISDEEITSPLKPVLRLANPNDLKSYLCRIVRNTALNTLEYNSAVKRDSRYTISLEEISDCVPATPDEDIKLTELADTISRFLRTQKEIYRKVFIRRYSYGDSVADIANCFSINEKTVATYLFRTRKKLKVFLKKEGYDYE